jgi:hypothetical protein
LRDVLPTSLALPHPDSCPGLWGSWRGIGGTRMARGALRVDLWRETPEVSACCGFRLPGGVFGGRASPVGDSSSWQLSPDMSAHRGSLLPSVPGTGAVWRQMPEMSTHIGSLLTLSGWQESSPTPHLGKRRVRLASSGNHLTEVLTSDFGCHRRASCRPMRGYRRIDYRVTAAKPLRVALVAGG